MFYAVEKLKDGQFWVIGYYSLAYKKKGEHQSEDGPYETKKMAKKQADIHTANQKIYEALNAHPTLPDEDNARITEILEETVDRG